MDPNDLWQFQNLEKSGENNRQTRKNFESFAKQIVEKNRLKKYYPKKIDEYCWTAIQLTTAFGVCCAVDHVLNNQDRYQGTLQHQDLALTDLKATPFGEYYDWEEKCTHS